MNELDIEVTPLVEDMFYIVLAADGKISDSQGEKIYDRIKCKYSESEYKDALQKAFQMVANLEKYGKPCNAWE